MSKQVISLDRPREQMDLKRSNQPIIKLVEQASKVIAPLWPLSTFIARHPWMELEHLPFSEVADRFQRKQQVDLYPTMASFRTALDKGEIDPILLENRLQRWLDELSLPALRHETEQFCRSLLWNEELPREWLASPELVQVVSELDEAALLAVQPISKERDEQSQRLNQQMIKWCKLFLDEGQAAWGLPFRERGFFGAWRQLVSHDPELTKNERRRLADWPDNAELALKHALSHLGVDEETIVEYLESHLLSLPGWAGMLLWRSQQAAQGVKLLIDYLAIRLSLEYTFVASNLLLTPERMDRTKHVLPLVAAWIRWGEMTPAQWKQLKPEEQCARLAFADRFWRLERYRLWLEAWEETYETRLKDVIISSSSSKQTKQPAAQFLFCIDVRSEPLRRYIEQQGPFETFGCAGFFGLPIRKRELDSQHTHPSCPAIVEPQHEICELAVPETLTQYRRRRSAIRFVGQTFKKVKQHLLASLLLPEMSGIWLGLHTLARIAAPQWGGVWIRQMEQLVERKPPTEFSLKKQGKSEMSELPVGFSLEEQVQYVKQLLSTIGFTSSFAPLVVVCGHESATVNNPYASSLDCGACGGAAGAFNARVFATLCNLPEVREGLSKEGITIPKETVFVAAEHITTVDELLWLEVPTLSEEAQRVFVMLENVLPVISRKANAERLEKLPHVGQKPRDLAVEVRRRSVDWSEIRPEWGLARNAAFFIGHRERTKHGCLDGRVFLHSYDWRKDPTGEMLSNIIAGPATVAQWINLQYYASTVAPHYYGSGSKTTQTITGVIGVMQGNASDLLSGLPWQSVAFSDRELFHSPLRLLVVIEAPQHYIERLLSNDVSFYQKVKNGWLRLASIDPDSGEWIKWEPSMI